MIVFISGTGTGVGKTWVTRGLAREASRRGARVVAFKPLETGGGDDGVRIAHAAGHRVIPGYRTDAPLAPYAAVLEGATPPDLSALVRQVQTIEADVVLVEGAGGLLTPIDATHDLADLASALAAPTLLVGRDELGVLSSLRTAYESARARGIDVAACVLTRSGALDPSTRTNARILAERLRCPVEHFNPETDEDDALAAATAPWFSRTLPGL